MTFSSYLGGNFQDELNSVAVDDQGRVAVGGSMNLLGLAGAPYPTYNAHQPIPGPNYQFVGVASLLDPFNSTFIFSTFVGGQRSDQVYGVGIDATGVYVVGETWGGAAHAGRFFPTSIGAAQQLHPAPVDTDAFAVKYDRAGAQIYATLIGGTLPDRAYSVEPDGAGGAWVATVTESTDFPACGNPNSPSPCPARVVPIHSALQGSDDVGLVQISDDGTQFLYGTYIGGSSDEFEGSVALDGHTGEVVLFARTLSNNLPMNPSAIQATPASSYDTFIYRFHPPTAGAAVPGSINFTTYLGGSNVDYATGVASDDLGNLYMTGLISGSGGTWSTTPQALQTMANNDPGHVSVIGRSPPEAEIRANGTFGIGTETSTAPATSPVPPTLEVPTLEPVEFDAALSLPGDLPLAPSRYEWTLLDDDGTTVLETSTGEFPSFDGLTYIRTTERFVCVKVWNTGPIQGYDFDDTACIGVKWTNQPPEAFDDEFTIVEDSGLNDLDVLDNDTDPESLELRIVGAETLPAAIGTMTHDGKVLRFTPAQDFYTLPVHAGSSPHISIEYTIEDPAGDASTANVTIKVQNVNDPPVAENDTYTMEPGSTTDLMVLDNDDDPVDPPGTLLVSAIDQPSSGKTMLPSQADRVAFTAHSLFVGTTSFNYTLIDEDGATDTATVTVQVEPTGGVLAYDDTFNVQEDDETLLDVMANDVGPDRSPPAILDSVSEPSEGEARISDDGLRIVYTPDEDHFGSDSFTYTLTRNGATSTATVNLTVTPVNDPPRARDDAFDLVEDSTGTQLAVLANDDSGPDDPEVLVVVDVGGASSGTTELADGKILYAPDPDFFDEESFTYTIEDPDGSQDSATVTVTVNNTPDAPIPVNDAFQVSAGLPGQELNVLANDVDVDGDTLTITEYEWDDTYGDMSNEGDVLKVSPGKTFLGKVVLRYRMTDGLTESDWATVTLDIVAPKDPLLVLRERTSPLCAEDPIHVRGIALQYNHTATTWNWSVDGHSEVFDHTGDIHDWSFTSDGGDVALTLNVRFEDDQGAHWAAETWQLHVLKCVDPVADYRFTTDGLRAHFEDLSIDPDGSLAAWHWDFDDEGTSSETSPTHTYAQGGHYLVRLTVTDDDGNTHSIERVVAISASGVGGGSGGSGGSGGGSGGSGDSEGSGGSGGAAGDDGPGTSEDAGSGGTGSDDATGTDGSGAQQEDRPPVAVASAPENVAPGDLVELDGSDSHDPDGDALTYRWIQTGGQAVDLGEPRSAKAAFTAPGSGELRFRLRVEAGDAHDDAEVLVRAVSLPAPRAAFETEIGDDVRLRDTSSDAEGATRTWFIDGQEHEGEEVALDLLPGDHEVLLVVENAFGRSESKQTVHVPEPVTVVDPDDPDPLALEHQPDQEAQMGLWGWGIVGLLGAAVVVAVAWLLRARR